MRSRDRIACNWLLSTNWYWLVQKVSIQTYQEPKTSEDSSQSHLPICRLLGIRPRQQEPPLSNDWEETNSARKHNAANQIHPLKLKDPPERQGYPNIKQCPPGTLNFSPPFQHLNIITAGNFRREKQFCKNVRQRSGHCLLRASQQNENPYAIL